MPITGKTACEGSFAGVGMAFGAVASGVSGGSLTLPAMLAGGTIGYLIGKAVCRIPAVQRAVDHALGLDDWQALELTLADPAVRKEAVALVGEELGVGPDRASQIWDGVVAAVKMDPRAVLGSPSFRAAAHHPATGSARHGMAVLHLTSSSPA